MEMVSETSQEPFEVGVGMRSPWISQLVPHDRLRLRSLAGAFLFMRLSHVKMDHTWKFKR